MIGKDIQHILSKINIEIDDDEYEKMQSAIIEGMGRSKAYFLKFVKTIFGPKMFFEDYILQLYGNW